MTMSTSPCGNRRRRTAHPLLRLTLAAAFALPLVVACGSAHTEHADPGAVVTITRTPPPAVATATYTPANPPGQTITQTITPPPATSANVPEPPPTPTAKPAAAQPRGLKLAPAPDLTNAAQVAEATLLTMYAADTAIDKDPSDATRRATKWMTPKLAGWQTGHGRYGGPGADWLALVEHKGYYVPSVRIPADNIAGANTTTGTTATITRAVQVIPRGTDQYVGDMRSLDTVLTLTLTPDGTWQVSNFQITEHPTVEIQP